MAEKMHSWFRILGGALLLPLYVSFAALATQATLIRSLYAHEEGLGRLPLVVPFAVLVPTLLLSVFRKSVQSTLAAKLTAGLLLLIFVVFTVFFWCSWGG